MAQFLFEIFSEEIPARMQEHGREMLQSLFTERLQKEGLSFTHIASYVTPRRLALVIDGLPLEQADQEEERKGPNIQAPAAAIEGFLKSTGVRLEECIQQDFGAKGIFWVTKIFKKGRPTSELLVEIIPDILKAMSWPKSMRWGLSSFTWVRPLRSILALFDKKVLTFIPPHPEIEVGGRTHGHRFLAPQTIHPETFEDYIHKLEKAYVILDQQKRKDKILKTALEATAFKGLTMLEDSKLLDEVTGLVEWPNVLVGKIDEKFMDLPPEVLTTTMKTHQRYFSTLFPNGKMAPFFVLTSNMETADQEAQIIAGNERVLRARLSDAAFYWEHDRKIPLAQWNEPLKNQIFHAQLGTMGDKVTRITQLVSLFSSSPLAYEAASLCKADLATGVVGEFPELQGIMGSYCADYQKLDPQVSQAIREHYAPLGPDDQCPTTSISVAVSLADKIDTITSFFSVGITPTGSKDPFALRRAALGIIRLILENQLNFSLEAAFRKAYSFLNIPTKPEQETISALLHFILERLKVYFKGRGFAYDQVAAVLSPATWNGNILRSYKTLNAFKDLLLTSEGKDLVAGYKRAVNIVRLEEKKTRSSVSPDTDSSLFEQDAEKILYRHLETVKAEVHTLLENQDPDFHRVMRCLAPLKLPIDDFFEKVTVQVDNPKVKGNRLKLLALIRSTLHEVADLSELEG
jgi:glycyl-tRNA synthetase beta chain